VSRAEIGSRGLVGRLDVHVVLPVALGGATILAQIAYPLVSGQPRNVLTIVTVLLFFAASVVHALLCRGLRFAATLVAVTAGGGLLAEAMGVRTGLPFGDYTYTGTLGWQLLGVPGVIPLAWTMMAYPALLVARRITASRVVGPLVAGWALASWDLFLDPQMVQAGHWVWDGDGAYLGIPVSNFFGWFVTAAVMMALLWRLPEGGTRRPDDDRVPYALYLWTYCSSVMAHAVFFGNPLVALVGGLGMGVVVLPFVRALRRPAGS
jgi:putative membrane protein